MSQPCGERVGRGTITWPCTLEQNHLGPCFATESTASAGDRRRWEAEQGEKKRQAESGLGQFQGPAQTTAQRYTENPTSVPLSAGRRRLHNECTASECTVYDGERSAQSECPTFVPVAQRPFDPHDREQRGKPWDREAPVGEIVQPKAFAEMPVGPPTDPMSGEPVPTKQREGDQRLPDGDRRRADIQSLVIADINARREVGIERYGQALQSFNGRDTLLDAYEEALDLTVYLRSLLEMKRADRERLVEAVTQAFQQRTPLGGDSEGIAEIAVDRILDAFA